MARSWARSLSVAPPVSPDTLSREDVRAGASRGDSSDSILCVCMCACRMKEEITRRSFVIVMRLRYLLILE